MTTSQSEEILFLSDSEDSAENVLPKTFARQAHSEEVIKTKVNDEKDRSSFSGNLAYPNRQISFSTLVASTPHSSSTLPQRTGVEGLESVPILNSVQHDEELAELDAWLQSDCVDIL